MLAGFCECSNEPSGSIKLGNFLTICVPVLLGKSCAPWIHLVSEIRGFLDTVSTDFMPEAVKAIQTMG
jgi:hypothetical protein